MVAPPQPTERAEAPRATRPMQRCMYEVSPLDLRADTDVPPDWSPLHGAIRCRTAPGRLADAAVAIAAGETPITAASIRVSKLVGPDGATLSVPADRIRSVVCTYVSTGDLLANLDASPGEGTRYVPYALFFNADLLGADHERRVPIVTWTDFADDQPPLRPRIVPAGQMRQWYVTIPVPADAAPGVYEGRIEFLDGEQSIDSAELRLDVPDMALVRSAKIFGIYNNLKFPFDDPRLKAMFDDLAEAGFLHPWLNVAVTSDGDGGDPTALNVDEIRRMMHLRGQAGLDRDFVIWADLGLYLEADPTPRAERMKAFWDEQGWPPLATYGEDEASGNVLKRATERWYEKVRRAGLRVAVSVSEGYTRYAGDAIDYPIMVRTMQPDPAEQATVWRARQLGATVLSHGNPQLVRPAPLLCRQRTGFDLWNGIYDGWYPFTYGWLLEMHRSGEIVYPGISMELWRPHGVVLVGTTRMIPQVEWPAMRQGVDDVRYASTLAAQVLQARDLGIESPELDSTETLLRSLADRIESAEAVHAARDEVIDAILRLQQLDARLSTRRLAKQDQAVLAQRINDWILPDLTPRSFPMGLDEMARLVEHVRTLDDPVEAVLRALNGQRQLDEARGNGRITNVEWQIAREILGEAMIRREAQALPLDSEAFADGFTVVRELNDHWLGTIDPEDHGRRKQWFSPGQDRSSWKPIGVQTYWPYQGVVPWQGFEGPRLSLMGVGWYALDFEAPADWADRDLYLWLQADDEALVYLNGVLIHRRDQGEPKQRASTPTIAPLTDALRPGDRNTLVIRVYNAEGAGGLIKGVRVVERR